MTVDDERGVALQTVIVIVVLLMIAGGVSAVLLGRSSDVVGELEAQGVAAITEQSCPGTRVSGSPGEVVGIHPSSVPPGFDRNSRYCIWEGTIGPTQCFTLNNGFLIALGHVPGGFNVAFFHNTPYRVLGQGYTPAFVGCATKLSG